jgi:hypothetical protein
LEDPDPTSEVQRKPLQLRSHFGNIFKIHVISSKYIYRIYIYTHIYIAYHVIWVIMSL